MKISEQPLDAEMLQNIKGCASEAAEMLGIDPSQSTAAEIVRAVDEWVYRWQNGDRPDVPEDDEPDLTLGSLWGEQLVAKLGWQWAGVTFEDHDDSKAVGVFSPDRALAVYPFHFVYGCMENADVPVTIMLAFNMLTDGTRIPDLPAGGYENVMDHVHHIVPRD